MILGYVSLVDALICDAKSMHILGIAACDDFIRYHRADHAVMFVVLYGILLDPLELLVIVASGADGFLDVRVAHEEADDL